MKIMAVSSGGGHWVQLLRLRPAFEGHEVTYVTVSRVYRADIPGCQLRAISDATRWNWLGLLRTALQLFCILVVERPDVVISTGAAPGYLALRMGKWLRVRTIWLDSAANVEELSLSGQRVGRYADLWLTQWPHLARREGPHFIGAVL